jgi:hypothetical protein
MVDESFGILAASANEKAGSPTCRHNLRFTIYNLRDGREGMARAIQWAKRHQIKNKLTVYPLLY